jgi:hypothetical protein
MPGYVTAIAASSGAFFAAVVRDNLARFYEIQLTASRTGTTVTELPIRPHPAPVALMAASPDGAELAYATEVRHARTYGVQHLVVASTTTDSERQWMPPASYSAGSMESMNWLADGRTLAFSWSRSLEKSPRPSSLRLLDTAAPGSDLMAGRTLLPSVLGAGAFEEDPTLSPNGEVVVGVASNPAASRAPSGSAVAFSTATGKPTVLLRASPSGGHSSVCYSPPVWLSNTGSEVLISCVQEVKATPTIAYVVNIVLINHGHATLLSRLDATAEGATAFP